MKAPHDDEPLRPDLQDELDQPQSGLEHCAEQHAPDHPGRMAWRHHLRQNEQDGDKFAPF
ncbi:MAG: hypothetical protein R3A10_12625 [Caldilineaceae bacterium]